MPRLRWTQSLPGSLLVLGGIGTFGSSSTTPSFGTTSNVASSSPARKASRNHSYEPREHLYKTPPSHFSLKQVIVIARHGDRAPIARNVGNVIKDSPDMQKFWSSKLPSAHHIKAWAEAYPPAKPLTPLDATEHPYSQLTVRGANELRALGSHLRKRYVSHLKFLPPTFEPSKVYARATNIRRTQQSAQNLLLGLYPEGSLPIEVRATDDETLYPNADRSCRRQEEIITELRKNDYNLSEGERRHYKALIQDALQRLDLNRFVPWNQVREVFTCWEVHDVPLPPQVDSQFIGNIIAFTGKMWGAWFRNRELARLGIGPFINELLDAVDKRVKDESSHHVLVYAGHDSTIVPILAALGNYDDIWPPYAANLVLEVAKCQKTGDHFIRCLYNDEEKPLGAVDHQKPIWCKLAEFDRMMGELVPVDYEAECRCIDVDSSDLTVTEDGVSSTIGTAEARNK